MLRLSLCVFCESLVCCLFAYIFLNVSLSELLLGVLYTWNVCTQAHILTM